MADVNTSDESRTFTGDASRSSAKPKIQFVEPFLDDGVTDDDGDYLSQKRTPIDEVVSWQWLLLELEGIQKDDSNCSRRKARWLQKVESWMDQRKADPSATQFERSSVVLYDLDATALSGDNVEQGKANCSPRKSKKDGSHRLSNALESDGAQVSRSSGNDPMCDLADNRSSVQAQDIRSPKESAMGNNLSERLPLAARDVFRRLTHATNRDAVSTQPTIDKESDATAPAAFQANTARSATSEYQTWAGRARRKLEDFDSNVWCNSAVQVFTLLLAGFELSQMCSEKLYSVQDGICLAFNSVDFFGNIIFTLEVLFYIMIFPWKFLFKSKYFWVDVAAIVTYYILVAGGWSTKQNGPVEFLSICIPLLRILKITRRSKSWRLLVMALRRSAEPITVPTLFLILVISIGSGILYFAEKYSAGPGETPAFESIPYAVWFSIVTVSTTGYGDLTPRTGVGKLVCCVLIGVGVCCFAMPLAVVGNCFCSVWEQRDVILLKEKLKSIFALAGLSFADLRELFDATDLDGSGDMELDEFIGFFKMLKLDIGRREIVKFFQLMDVTGCGKVSFDEFREHLGLFHVVDFGHHSSAMVSMDSLSPRVFGHGSIASKYSSNDPGRSCQDLIEISNAPSIDCRDSYRRATRPNSQSGSSRRVSLLGSPFGDRQRRGSNSDRNYGRNSKRNDEAI